MDIVFLVIVAVVIIWRLFSIIGQDLGGNKDAFKNMSSMADTQEKPTPKNPEKTIPNPRDIPPQETLANQDIITRIQRVEPNFDAPHFINGAKICFANTLNAFADGNKQALQDLLAPETYHVFADVLDAREAKGERCISEVVGFIKIEILDMTVNGDMLEVEVDFTTDQITATYDSEDRVIAGHPSDIVRLQDDWVFVRKIGDKAPQWYVKETS